MVWFPPPLTNSFVQWQTYSLHFVLLTGAAAAAKLLQPCLILCDPIDSSAPGSPVAGILQARTLEWVAISFSNAWKWKVKVKSLSCVRLLATPWTAAYQAPPSMGFSRQEYWSGVPLPSPTEMLVLANSNWCLTLMEHFKVFKALVTYFSSFFTFKFTSVLCPVNRSRNVPHSAVYSRNSPCLGTSAKLLILL